MLRKVFILGENHLPQYQEQIKTKIKILTSDKTLTDVIFFTEAYNAKQYETGLGIKVAIPILKEYSDIGKIIHTFIYFSEFKKNPTIVHPSFNMPILEVIELLLKNIFPTDSTKITQVKINTNPSFYFNMCKQKIKELLNSIIFSSRELLGDILVSSHDLFKCEINSITFETINDRLLSSLLVKSEVLVNEQIIANVLKNHYIYTDINIPFYIVVGNRHIEDIRIKLSSIAGLNMLIHTIPDNETKLCDIMQSKNFEFPLSKKYLKYKAKYIKLKNI